MATARDVITRSLRLVGILGAEETGDSPELIDSLATLNAFLEAWPLSTLMVLSTGMLVAPLTPAFSYQLGPGLDIDTPRPASIADASFIRYQGSDTPLTMLNQQEYNAIYSKFPSGLPQFIYYDPGTDAGTLTLYPGPTTGMELHLAVNGPFTQFADLDTDYPLPPGYLRALQYNLAIEIAPEYGREASATVQKIAITSVRQIKKANANVPLLGMPCGVPINGWASFNSLMAGY